MNWSVKGLPYESHCFDGSYSQYEQIRALTKNHVMGSCAPTTTTAAAPTGLLRRTSRLYSASWSVSDHRAAKNPAVRPRLSHLLRSAQVSPAAVGPGAATDSISVTSDNLLPNITRADGSPSNAGSGGGGGHCVPIFVRPAEMTDYWPAADLHCQVFNHELPNDQVFKVLSLRVDRIMALQINDRLVSDGAGNSVLLLAFEGEATGSSAEQIAAAESAFKVAAQAAATRESPTCAAFPHPMWWLGGSLAPGVRPGVGITAQSIGLVGVAAVDSFCDLVPPRELNWRTDGQMGWYRREEYSYVSNVAVAYAARRRGVARRLMEAAEAMAAEWGSRAVGLHCNPKKREPWALYRSLGYRNSGIVEPAFMPYLQGRPPDRCSFLIKVIPTSRRKKQQQQAKEG